MYNMNMTVYINYSTLANSSTSGSRKIHLQMEFTLE